MRDLDRWKDKVEISLDGRQIFFLFFGSAVAACLIFVVGVLIGKRIEARALAMTPAPIEDPLAALDQLGDADEADEGLTFHKALAPSSLPKATRVSEAREPLSDEPKADKLVETVKAETPRPEPKAETPKPEPVKAEPAKAELASKDNKPAPPSHVEDKKAAPLPPSRAQVVAAA